MTNSTRSLIEASTLRSWPALHDKRLEAWRLRLSEGYTGRANSATFLGPGFQGLRLSESIAACEAQFSECKLPPIFRLPSYCTPPAVEVALKERNYAPSEATAVLLVGTNKLSTNAGPPGSLHKETSVDSWMAYYKRFTEKGVHNDAAHTRILKAIANPSVLALWEVEREIVACGVAAADRSLCGLFDLAVAPQRRRQGHGRQLVKALVGWGKTQGAASAYLQVEKSNEAAMGLYADMGFEERYHYRYWSRE